MRRRISKLAVVRGIYDRDDRRRRSHLSVAALDSRLDLGMHVPQRGGRVLRPSQREFPVYRQIVPPQTIAKSVCRMIQVGRLALPARQTRQRWWQGRWRATGNATDDERSFMSGIVD